MTDLPRRVLVATDGSEHATRAVRVAADLSRRAGAELHVVHVRKRLPVRSSLRGSVYFDRMFEEYADLYEEEAVQLIRRQVFLAKAEGADVADAYLREGGAVEEITGLARGLAANLVVVGSRGVSPVERLVKGSVSERVVRLAACPTLVVRGGEDAWPPGRLVVGDDSSEEARRAGNFAAGVGKLFGIRALLVRAHPPRLMFGTANVQNRGIPEEKLEMGDGSLEERATGLERTFGRRPEVKAVIGDPASALQQAADESEEPTLTVVGSRGLGAVRRFTLGSVSTDVLGAVAGPVLVVPSPKGVTPKSILPAKTVPATDGAVEANGRSNHRRG